MAYQHTIESYMSIKNTLPFSHNWKKCNEQLPPENLCVEILAELDFIFHIGTRKGFVKSINPSIIVTGFYNELGEWKYFSNIHNIYANFWRFLPH